MSVAPIRRAARAVHDWIGAAPATHSYLLVLLVTSTLLRSLHPPTLLLRAASTNLTQMGRSAPRVLFLSAFLLDGDRWLMALVFFSLILVPLERWAHTWRWLIVLLSGHVGATLVTTVGIWADVRSNRGGDRLANTVDVGFSYGLFAGAAFLTFAPRRRAVRIIARLAFATILFVAFARSHSFTNAGHIAASILGAACWLVLGPGLKAPAAEHGASTVTSRLDVP